MTPASKIAQCRGTYYCRQCRRPRPPYRRVCDECRSARRREQFPLIYRGDALTVQKAMQIVEALRDRPADRKRVWAFLDVPPVAGVAWSELCGSGRTRRISTARAYAAVALHDLAGRSFTEIAVMMGQRDRGHNTFSSAYRKLPVSERDAFLREVNRRLCA